MLGSSKAIREKKRSLAETELPRGTGLLTLPAEAESTRPLPKRQVMPIYMKKQLRPGPPTALTQQEQAMP